MPEDSTAKVDEEEEVAVPYMLMKVAPFIRTPLTDIVAHSMTYQSSDACPDFEMRTVECIEAYGLVKGKQKCKDYMADLEECLHKHKQVSTKYCIVLWLTLHIFTRND